MYYRVTTLALLALLLPAGLTRAQAPVPPTPLPPAALMPPAAPPSDPAAQARTSNDQGVAAFNGGDFSRAETLFAQAVHLDPRAALYVTNDALAWERQTRPDRAVACISAALPAFKADADRQSLRATLADAQIAWARAREEAAAYDDALVHFRAAAVLHLELRSSDIVSDLCGISGVWSVQNKYRQAGEAAEQAVSLSRALKAPEAEANARLARCTVAQALARYGPAIEDAREAARLFHEAKNAIGEGNALQRLGESERVGSSFDVTSADFARAADLLHGAHDGDDEASALTDWAGACADVSRYDQAVSLYRRALGVGSTNRFVQENILNGLANAESDLGQFPQAQTDLTRALTTAWATGSPVLVGQVLTNVAWTLDRAGQPTEALPFYRKALAIQSAAGDIRGAAYAQGDLGVAFQHLRQFRRAVAQYDRALPLIRRTRERRLEGRILDWRGWALACQGRTDALADLSRALAINREIQDPDGEGLTLAHLMSASQAHPRLAVFYGKQAVNAYQRVRGGLHGLDASAQRSYVKSNEGTYRTLASLLIGQGRLPEAQQVLGLLKEQELNDFLRGAAGEGGAAGHSDYTPAEQAVDAQYLRIADQVTALGRQKQALLDKDKQAGGGGPPFTPADQARLDALTAQLAGATRHLQSFLAHLADAFDAPSKEDRRLQTRLAAIGDDDDLQDALRQLHAQGQDAVVLETLVAPDRYAVIVTTAQSQRVAQYLIPAEELNKKVAAFASALRDPRADPRPLAQDLYRILIGPIEKDLAQSGAKTLMWSLDGTLRYLPMAALYDGEQYLVERYDNEVFTLGRRSGFGADEHAQWQGLGLGVSLPHADFNPLPAVPAELRGVIQDDAAPGAGGVVPGTVLLDPQFTQAAMTHALQQGRYTLVHVASHFALKPGDSDHSFLLLGDGAHMSLSDVAADHTLFAGVDLLSLSACNTALGDAGADGREVDSLGSIAQKDGAKSVLASLWPVADASTRLLMECFYRTHQTQPGVTKAGALRQAQLSLLRGTASWGVTPTRGTASVSDAPADTALPPFVPDPKAPYAHPFYWAPFILIGNWR